jgi:hypothetical protein
MERIDVWQTAALLLGTYGEAASNHAARRISDLTAQGDLISATVWTDILAAVASLRIDKGEVRLRRFSPTARRAALRSRYPRSRPGLV